jgi:uncharacterized alkaline shock family protein YloU
MSDVSPPVSIPNHVPFQRPDGDVDFGGGPVTGSVGVPVPFAPSPQTASASASEGSPGDRFSDALERATAASGRVASQFVDRLRNNAEIGADRGTTTIADEVVEKIAGIATREVPGVHDLGGDVARVFAGLRERIGLGDADDDTDRGIRVRLDGRRALVEITLVVEYGYVVRAVSDKVRANVIGAVENLLDLEVTEVNIRVDDVHVPDGIGGQG